MVPFFSLNNAQIIYILIIVSGFGLVYGRKFYKDHKKKQARKDHRREWNAKR